MYSRHSMALLGTVRHFAPPPQAADADGFLNLPPWEGVPGGWDLPDYALGAADSGDLPLITDLPDTASGDVPLSGLPSTPPPVIGGGGEIDPGPNTLPTDYVFEDDDGELVTGTYTLDNLQYWALEIRTSGGALVQEVTEHWAGSAVFNVDQAPELEFCTTLDAFDNFATVGNREIWLRDWRRHLMGRFEIVRVERAYNGAARYFRIQAQGIVARLSQAPVITYSTPVDSVENEDGSITRTRHYSTAGVIVQELLAFQTRTPFFSVGYIDPAIRDTARMFTADDTNVMDALRQLQNSQPVGRSGFLWIDDQNRLQWRLRIGVDRAVLSSSLPTPSLRGATVRMCLDEMATRVYLFGALKTTDTFTSLTDAGQPNDYLQANTGTYGVRSARRTDNRIKYPETLLAAAQRILAETSVPYYEVEVDTVDLVKADGDYGAVDLWPGSEYRIDDDTASPLSGVYLTAQSVTYDLSNPLATGIKLANRARRLSDIFDRILGQLNPTVDEDTLLENWEGEEDGDPYPRHFSRMVARSMEEATDPDTPVGESLADAFRELLESYIPPFDTESGPNENNIADALQDHETRIQELEEGEVVLDYGAQTDIKPVVAGDAVAGTLDKVARADHQHKGVPILTETSAPTVPNTPCLWFEVDSNGKPLKMYAAMLEGATMVWACISHLEAEEGS
jgi:hypothetical protein